MNNASYCMGARSGRLCDMPEQLRPREQIERFGVERVDKDVLLAVVLRSGVRGVNVLKLARDLLSAYPTLTDMAKASVGELAGIHGMGRVKAQVLKAALELALRLSRERIPGKCSIRRPEDAVTLLREDARTLDQERFWVLLLDAKNCLKEKVDLTKGLLDASLVHPREVFCEAIRNASAAVVLAHNHPSGDPTPSAEDIRITRQIVDAGRIVDIAVLDHVIIGRPMAEEGNQFVSMREAGVVSFTK